MPMSLGRGPGQADYQVRLYIGGNSARSAIAVSMVKDICEEWLGSDYVLEVIDLHQQLSLAERDRIVAVPTLVKQNPLPARRTVGNLTRERVLAGLDLS
jgi:circadian clock protein KaiB